MKEVSNTVGADLGLAKLIGDDSGPTKESQLTGINHKLSHGRRLSHDCPINWKKGNNADSALGIGRHRSGHSVRQLMAQVRELIKKIAEGFTGNASSIPNQSDPATSTSGCGIGTGTSQTTDASNESKTLLHLKTDKDPKGNPTIKTDDGYTLNFEGTQQAWTITGPEGKTTRIWGDPHVNESDGDAWDFKDQATFVFGNNKLTIETTPYGNGETLTKSVHLYNGGERVSITDIDKDKPRLVSQTKDAKTHDTKLKDGDQYIRGQDPRTGGEGWIKVALNSIVKVFQPVFDLFSGGVKKTENVQQDDIFKVLN